jgi:ATP-binding protein involved in chromosome partitioning
MKSLICCAVKGGVGKTTTTAGIGKALCRQGKKVAYLDLDYFGPTLNLELKVTEPLDGDGHGHIIPSHAPDGSQFVSFGQVYIRDQAVTVNEDSAVYEISQLLEDGSILWDSPDYLMIDTAPTSSGTIQASLKAPGLLGAVIVTQPSDLSEADLLRSFSLMKDKRVPILGVVINQGYYICPKCGTESALYDLKSSDITEICEKWDIPVLGMIPHSANLDDYFDTLAQNVLAAVPVILPEDKKPSKSVRRVLGWLGKILPSATTNQK